MAQNNRLLLIDANSIVHRAYHALPNLMTSKGAHTGAIYGFLTIFLRIVAELSPTHVAAAFDLKAPTFRHKLYAPYKGEKFFDAVLLEYNPVAGNVTIDKGGEVFKLNITQIVKMSQYIDFE